MTGMEIFLIFLGIFAIAISFVASTHDEKNNEVKIDNLTEITDEIVRKQVDEKVSNILDEAVEKTEASLDKIVNNKIMAVGDYSENVLTQINKNHEEVMFLYGMLNDKEKDIKDTVRDIEQVKKSIKISGMQADKLMETANASINENNKEQIVNDSKNKKHNDKSIDKQNKNNSIKKDENIEESVKEFRIPVSTKKSGVAISKYEASNKTNNNKKILDLYNKGKTNIEIARQLNLGMGEVRLVIDLYKNKVN